MEQWNLEWSNRWNKAERQEWYNKGEIRVTDLNGNIRVKRKESENVREESGNIRTRDKGEQSFRVKWKK